MFFNPANPRFRRGTVLASTISCTLVGVHILMSDFGTQRHVFTPVQQFLVPKIDQFFGITERELTEKHVEVQRDNKPWLTIKKPPTPTTSK